MKVVTAAVTAMRLKTGSTLLAGAARGSMGVMEGGAVVAAEDNVEKVKTAEKTLDSSEGGQQQCKHLLDMSVSSPGRSFF